MPERSETVRRPPLSRLRGIGVPLRIGLVLILVLLTLGALRSSVVEWNDVPSPSMRPTILEAGGLRHDVCPEIVDPGPCDGLAQAGSDEGLTAGESQHVCTPHKVHRMGAEYSGPSDSEVGAGQEEGKPSDQATALGDEEDGQVAALSEAVPPVLDPRAGLKDPGASISPD